MSTGLNCEIRELAPGAWYYVLQLGSCPRQIWDWHDECDVVGPYSSEDAAYAGLSDNEANPGGYNVVPFEESPDNAKLLAKARRAHGRRWSGR